jgi:hypothetical protein
MKFSRLVSSNDSQVATCEKSKELGISFTILVLKKKGKKIPS